MSKSVGGLYVELSADNKKLNSGVEDSLKKLKEAQNDLKGMNFDDLKENLSGVSNQMKKVAVDSKMLTQNLTDFKDSLKNMKPEEIDELFDESVNKVQELKQFMEQINNEITRTGESWRFGEVITQTENALNSYNDKLKVMEEIMNETSSEPVKEIKEELKQSKNILSGFIASFKEGFTEGFNTAKDKAHETTQAINRVSNSIKHAGNQCKEFGKNAQKGFKKGITSLKKFLLGLLGIRTAFGYLTTNMRAYINTSESLKSKTEGIAQALQQSLAPYAEIAVVALQKVVHWVILAIAYFTTFINTIFGTKIAIGGLSKNMKNLSANTKKAGAEAKKALAPFDELNILQEDTGGGVSDSVIPDFSGLGLDDIDTSGLDKFAQILNNLKEHAFTIFDNIKTKIKEAWDSQPVQAFVGFAISYGKFLWDYWSMIGTTLYNSVVGTWNDISSDVSEIWNNLSSLWTMFWTDMSTTINKWGPTIIEDIRGVFTSIWKDAIDPGIKIAIGIFKDLTTIMNELWNKYGAQLLDNIGETIHTTIRLFQSLWDNIIKPIIEPFLEQLRWLWDTKLKDMIKTLTDFVMKAINFALMIYNKVIAPIISWIVDKLAPIWTAKWNALIGVISSVLGAVSDIVKGIIKSLSGVIDFLTGIFTGDWEKAWKGVVDIFEGIFDSIVGVVKGVINIVVDVLNGFIKGLNRIKIDVPDWVPNIGGKKWGFNMKTLPKLKTGDVVTSPLVAEIGEYTGAKNNPEIVSPRDTMYETFVDALKDTLGNNQYNTTSQTELTINVKYEDGRTIIKKINTAQNEAGRTLLEV